MQGPEQPQQPRRSQGPQEPRQPQQPSGPQQPQEHIGPEEFARRLGSLCVRAGGAGLPKKRSDRHILLQSMILALEPGRVYREAEINAALKEWKETAGSRMGADHVSLRRELVDSGYLVRDAAGGTYLRGGPKESDIVFDPGVEAVRPAEVVAAAAAEIERKRREHQADEGSSPTPS